MPTARMALEKLKYMVEHGRAEEKVHVVFVEQEQKERIANNKRKTRFVLVCSDPDLCSEFEAAKDRIFRKCKVKAIMETFMIRAWNEALSDKELDRMMAEEEGPR